MGGNISEFSQICDVSNRMDSSMNIDGITAVIGIVERSSYDSIIHTRLQDRYDLETGFDGGTAAKGEQVFQKLDYSTTVSKSVQDRSLGMEMQ